MAPKKKTAVPADQARALSDYRCAVRKIAALLDSRGETADALFILEELERITELVREVR